MKVLWGELLRCVCRSVLRRRVGPRMRRRRSVVRRMKGSRSRGRGEMNLVDCHWH